MISKVIYLPSGGVFYSPTCEIKPITNELKQYYLDPHGFFTPLEKKYSVINYFCKCDVPIKNMFIFDFFYIWMYIENIEISEKIPPIYDICKFCEKENKVMVPFDEMDFVFINQFEDWEKIFKFDYRGNNYTILFKQRSVEDLFIMQNLNIYNIENEEDKHLFYLNSILTSILEIEYEGKKIDKKHWKSFFETVVNILEFKEIMSTVFNNTFFPFDNIFNYNCIGCGKENHLVLFNEFRETIMSPREGEFYNNQKVVLKNLISQNALNIFGISDYFKLPLKFNKPLDDIISNQLEIRGMGSTVVLKG